MQRKRVIVWGTGLFGLDGLRAVIDHPDLELVGLHAHSPAKQGQDAGTLAGVAATGVIATNDAAELLALDADCIVYFSSVAGRMAEATAEVVPFLERGTCLS